MGYLDLEKDYWLQLDITQMLLKGCWLEPHRKVIIGEEILLWCAKGAET
jgi:hypothetical protein